MMRYVSRFLLWTTGLVVPVMIAACYGMSYAFTKCGKVVDAESKAGIGNIEVTCMRDGVAGGGSYTDVEGGFCLGYDEPCDTLEAVDVDGEENGGEYQSKSVPFDGEDDVTIKLTK